MNSQSNKLNAYTIYLFLSAIGSFAMYTISTISGVYLFETVKLNPFQLVFVGTILETAVFICQVPTGVLADAYSRRMSVVIGYSLMGVGFLLEGLVPTFTAALLAQVLWGAGATFVSGAEEAWVADEVEGDMTHVFIRGTQIGQLASLISIPLSIWLASYRLNLPIIAGGSLFLLLGVFLFICMPERHFHPAPREERTSWQMIGKIMTDGGKAVSRSRMLLLILAITAFGAMASEGFDRLNTAHFLQDYHFPQLGHLSSVTWFGILGAGSMLLVLLATELVRRNVNTSSQRAIIVTMFGFKVLLIASVAVFALAGNFYLALLAFWCATICRRADSPLYNAWIIRNSDPRLRATIISMFGQVDAIGQIVGGPGVGLIGTLASLRAALLTTCAILSPNIIFFARALHLSQHTPTFTDTEAQETIPISTP